MKHLVVLITALFVSAASGAQEPAWHDRMGNPAPDTESRRSVKGFGGWLVVTPDTDWREKWQAPSVIGPVFEVATSVPRGKPLFILAFFANPWLGADRQASVSCDFDVLRPDGSNSFHEANAVCFKGPMTGNPANMYLSGPVVGFTGNASDPTGSWTVHVTLRDDLGNTVIPLKTSFTLQ